MSKIKKSWMYVLVVACVLTGMTPAVLAASSSNADKQLQKGIEAYRNHDNDKAMDYFVDVLMHGDKEQAARANNYINAIHNQLGGINTPVEVSIAFPEQPTQTIVDEANNLANYGTERLNTLADQAGNVEQETKAALKDQSQSLTEQIESRQLANYLQETAPVTDAQAAAQDAQAVASQLPENGLQTTQQDLAAIKQEVAAETAAAATSVPSTTPTTAPASVEQQPSENVVAQSAPATTAAPVEKTFTPVAQPVQNEPATTVAPAEQTLTQITQPENQAPNSVFADLTSDSAVAARTIYTTQKLQSMTDGVMKALQDEKGVHLYVRNDGKPDALDIDDAVVFQGSSFRPEAFATLNNIYELLALTQGAHYTILPAGSYTDDVTLAGIRQAMALKSYLVKRGISQGKLSYNMGLVDEEVPAQFSNLKGLSIVFDYDAKLPTRLLDNEGNITEPLLSMAIVPPCHAIDRSLGEAYAIDFSVLETVNPLDSWVLQVILHGRDGKYYIVRQLEGFSPVYHQILWNGRKGIIGPELPCGKYTLVLTATDLQGNKQTERHRVVVKCAQDTPVGSCQMGSCAAKQQTKEVTTLNYKSARLWKKPGRVMNDGKTTKQEVIEKQEIVEKQEDLTQQAAAVSTQTQDNTYTVTKTVRNIVTDDNTPLTTDTTSASSSSSTQVDGMGNPYAMSYEEEYTTY